MGATNETRDRSLCDGVLPKQAPGVGREGRRGGGFVVVGLKNC